MGNLISWFSKGDDDLQFSKGDDDLHPIEAKNWVKLMEEEQKKYRNKKNIEIKKLDSNKEIIYFEVEENLPSPTQIELKKVNYYYGGINVEKDMSEKYRERYFNFMGIKTNIYRMSMNENDEIKSYGNKNFIKGYLNAYNYHCPLGFSPDTIWQIILVCFAKHIDTNAEKLRHLFVDFENKQSLNIPSFTNTLEEISLEEWQDIFSNLNKEISKYVKGEIIDLITPNFSTTTKTSLAAAQASIMASMKNYFEFNVGCVGCGIPKVYLEGSLEDWEKLLIKVKSLEKYELKWWTDNLQKVIKKIIETKKMINLLILFFSLYFF